MNDYLNHDSIKTRKRRGNSLAYLQKNRGKPQYRHAPSASRATNKVLRPLSRKFGPGVNSLRAHWPEIIGQKWAALSKPTAVRGSIGAKTLQIEAKGPAAAMLQADSNQIRDKVNQFLGADTISKIVVKQGRIQINTKKNAETSMDNQHSVSKMVQTDKNETLKSALDRLGQNIKSRTNKLDRK